MAGRGGCGRRGGRGGRSGSGGRSRSGGRSEGVGCGTNLVVPSTVLHSDSSASVQQEVDISPPVTGSENAAQTLSTSIGSTSADVESTTQSNVRGKTSGRGARMTMKSVKAKLPVQFNFHLGQATCENAEKFNNEIGIIVRRECSLKYKDWRLVPEEVRTPLRHRLLTLFEIDVENEKVQKVIDSQMQKAWKGYKYTLHSHFKKIGGEEDPNKAKSIGHDDVNKEDWDYLCEIWSNASFKERAQKNADSRKKRPWETRNGSKTTTRHHVARGVELDAPRGQIETWRIRHCPKNDWPSQEFKDKYEEMMQLRQENPPEIMSDKAIMEKVLGRHSNRLFGWGRSPSKSRGTCSDDGSRPTYNQILNDLDESKAALVACKSHVETLVADFLKVKQVLIEKDIVSHSSTSDVPSNQSVGPSHAGGSPANDDDYYEDDLC